MKNKTVLFLTALPVVVTISMLPSLPDKIPAHYNYLGEIDRWGSKYETLILPVLIVLTGIICLILLNKLYKSALVSVDEKSSNDSKNNLKIVKILSIGTLIIFNIIQAYLIFNPRFASNGSITFDLNMILCVAVGIILIIVGNYLPTARRNSMIGFRTKQSVTNDQLWYKANRIAGVSSVISGMIIIIQSFYIKGITSIMIMVAILILSSVISAIYSYKISKV